MTPNTTPAPAVQANLWRKKPVVIQATQWFKNGDHPDDYAEDQQGLENGELRTFTGAERKANGWEGGVVRYYRHPDVPSESLCEQCGKPHHIHGWIDTLEQGHRVCPGDWIITGVKGERYPCKPDIFHTTYEAAGLSVQPVPDAPLPTQNSVRCAACDKPAVSTIASGVASFPTCPCGSLRFNALVGASPAATACSGLRPSAADASSPSVPPAGAWQPIETAPNSGRILLWWRGAGPVTGAFRIDEDWSPKKKTPEAGWSGDGDECVPRNQADCTHWMLLPDAPEGCQYPRFEGQPCPHETMKMALLYRAVIARGMEARSGETEGLDPKGDSPVGLPTRPDESSAEQTTQLPQAEPSDAELRAWRERFPAYVYRPQDDCVSLKLKQQEQTR